jgi:hypothetical protein
VDEHPTVTIIGDTRPHPSESEGGDAPKTISNRMNDEFTHSGERR